MSEVPTEPETASAAPAPLPPPNEADELAVREVMESSHELEHVEDDRPAPQERADEPVPGLKFLTSIMKATFFTDLFCYHADIRYGHPTRAERVSAHVSANPAFYKACRNADLIARGVLMIVVVGLTGAVGWGTVVKLFY